MRVGPVSGAETPNVFSAEAVNQGLESDNLAAFNTALKNEQTHRTAWKVTVQTHATLWQTLSSPKKPVAFEQRYVAPPTGYLILVLDKITGATFHVEELKKKLVLKTLTSQHVRVGNCPSAALEWLIELVVRKMLSSPKTIAEVTGSVLDNPGFIYLTTTSVKSGHQKCTD